VRRQGGRAFNDPISFPTLTVRSPNELTGDASKQVAVELALGFSQKLQKKFRSVNCELRVLRTVILGFVEKPMLSRIQLSDLKNTSSKYCISIFTRSLVL
jgi:hypothetical protein